MSVHPYLFAGFNTAPNNGDEVDGPGLAFFPPGTLGGTGVSPAWVCTTETPEILIITMEMLAIFDDCADLVIPCEPDTVVFPREVETLVIRGNAA